jgi:hypothetical protein
MVSQAASDGWMHKLKRQVAKNAKDTQKMIPNQKWLIAL